MFTFDYTLTRSLTYSSLEHLAAAADGRELPEEMELEVEIEYSVYGESRPATWGYYGGEPAESPELALDRITTLDDDGNQVEVTLTPQEEHEVEEAAWQHIKDYQEDPY